MRARRRIDVEARRARAYAEEQLLLAQEKTDVVEETVQTARVVLTRRWAFIAAARRAAARQA